VALVSPLSHQPVALSVANLHHSVSVAICYRAATGLLPMPSILQVKGRWRAQVRRHGQSTSRSFDTGARPSNGPPRSRRPGRGKDRADRTVCV